MVEKQAIRRLIQQKLLRTGNPEGISDADSLIESGILDSFGIQILIDSLEKDFAIKVSDVELIPENFESIDAIARFVEEKLAKKQR
jgi:acyl carrier protein